MGQRTAGATLVEIFGAFLEKREWAQVALAKRCGVGVKALRKRLDELSRLIPVRDERRHPDVIWSVPDNWLPAGSVLRPPEVALVARLLGRLARSADRAQALAAVLGVREGQLELVEDGDASPILRTIEDAAAQRRVARIDYHTGSRNEVAARDISVHRIEHGDRVRLLATCHRTATLKYFRLEEVRSARLATGAFRGASSGEINAFLNESLDGYRAPADALPCAFHVKQPDAAWVSRNLPRGPILAEHVAGGIRFTTTTAALDVLARFVVGLGSSARAESPELRRCVNDLARGALAEPKPVRKLGSPPSHLKQASD